MFSVLPLITEAILLLLILTLIFKNLIYWERNYRNDTKFNSLIAMSQDNFSKIYSYKFLIQLLFYRNGM